MADKKAHEPELTPGEAVQEFEKGAKENPNDGLSHFNLGSALYVSGDWDGALKEFEQAATLAPSLAHAHYYLGVLYAKRGDKDKARQELDTVLTGGGNVLLKNQAKIQLDLMAK